MENIQVDYFGDKYVLSTKDGCTIINEKDLNSVIIRKQEDEIIVEYENTVHGFNGIKQGVCDIIKLMKQTKEDYDNRQLLNKRKRDPTIDHNLNRKVTKVVKTTLNSTIKSNDVKLNEKEDKKCIILLNTYKLLAMQSISNSDLTEKEKNALFEYTSNFVEENSKEHREFRKVYKKFVLMPSKTIQLE